MAHVLSSNKLVLTVDDTPYQIKNIDSISFTNPVQNMKRRGADGTGAGIVYKVGLAEPQSLEVTLMDIGSMRPILHKVYNQKYKTVILEWIDENTGDAYRAKDVTLENEPIQAQVSEEPTDNFSLKFTFFDVEFSQG